MQTTNNDIKELARAALQRNEEANPVDALKAKIASLETELAELRADRDNWRKQALDENATADALASQPAPADKPAPAKKPTPAKKNGRKG
jgi:molecular chaperone GrpE (heat shock protein)